MTFYIIIFTVITSVIAFNKEELFYRFQFNAYQIKYHKQYFRFLTHAFIHADWVHLLMNMFVLFFFGTAVEEYFNILFQEKGFFYFILLYVGGILFAALPSYKRHQEHSYYNSVGASGAVSAIVFSSVIFDPVRSICLYGVLCFPGILWAIAYLIYSYYKGKQENDFINHDAHFLGAVFGALFTIALKPTLALYFFSRLMDLF
ncbi:MAG: rhomboid family intramembrane serine protease [Bacteroidia bacterium]